MAELEFNPRAGHNSTPLKQEQACLALALLVIFSLARTTLFPGCRSWDWLLSPFCALSCLRLSHSWLLRLCWVQPLSVASRFCFPPICSAKCWLPVFLVNPWGGSCEFGWPCSLLSIVSIQNSLLDQWCGVCWGKEKGFFYSLWQEELLLCQGWSCKQMPLCKVSWYFLGNTIKCFPGSRTLGSLLNYYLTSKGMWAFNCCSTTLLNSARGKVRFSWTESLIKGVMGWIFDRTCLFC